MKWINILLLAMLIVMPIGCARQISQEEAIDIAQRFVNTQVKFYVDENKSDTAVAGVSQAQITVISVQKVSYEWNVVLHVVSNVSGETRSRGVVVVVDARDGAVKPERLQQFKI